MVKICNEKGNQTKTMKVPASIHKRMCKVREKYGITLQKQLELALLDYLEGYNSHPANSGGRQDGVKG